MEEKTSKKEEVLKRMKLFMNNNKQLSIDLAKIELDNILEDDNY